VVEQLVGFGAGPILLIEPGTRIAEVAHVVTPWGWRTIRQFAGP
jgi:hypothetical protein